MLEPIDISVKKIYEPSTVYTHNKNVLTLFGDELFTGTFSQLDESQLRAENPTLFYHHPHGQLWVGDTIAWLRTLASESVDLVFADPPYNIKKAEWDSFESQIIVASLLL